MLRSLARTFCAVAPLALLLGTAPPNFRVPARYRMHFVAVQTGQPTMTIDVQIGPGRGVVYEKIAGSPLTESRWLANDGFTRQGDGPWHRTDAGTLATMATFDYPTPDSFRRPGDRSTVTRLAPAMLDGILCDRYHVATPAGSVVSVEADLWIGRADRYIHRITSRSTKFAGVERDTIDFTDFGRAVTVTLPPHA